MNHTKLVSALVGTGMLLGAGSAAANEDQPIHITGQVGAYYTDSDRHTRDDDVWWSLGVGYFITNDFSLDLEYDRFSGTWADYQDFVPGATYDQWGLTNIGLMGRWHFTEWGFRPFLAAGLGSLEHRNVSSEDSSMSYSLGGGFRGQFTRHVAATVQLLYRRDSDDNSMPDNSQYGDWILSAGLSLDFGGERRPPPPPEEPAAPPPPPFHAGPADSR